MRCLEQSKLWSEELGLSRQAGARWMADGPGLLLRGWALLGKQSFDFKRLLWGLHRVKEERPWGERMTRVNN